MAVLLRQCNRTGSEGWLNALILFLFLVINLIHKGVSRNQDVNLSARDNCGIRSVSKCSFSIAPDYNFRLSTSENYAASSPIDFSDKYGHFRRDRNYSRHKAYVKDRVEFQNCILDEIIYGGREDVCGINNSACEPAGVTSAAVKVKLPRRRWLLFTAGAMGVGKGYILKYLNTSGVLPLGSFVIVDHDVLRMRLPEYPAYCEKDYDSAGEMTHREVSLMVELLIEAALQGTNRDVLVDGSLRNCAWYYQFLEKLLRNNSIFGVGIIEVRSSLSTAKLRSKERESAIRRRVPDRLIEEAYRDVPASVEMMKPLTDIIVYIQNDMNHSPIIEEISLINPNCTPFEECLDSDRVTHGRIGAPRDQLLNLQMQFHRLLRDFFVD